MHAVVGLGRWLVREAVAAIAPVVNGCAVIVGRQCGNSALGRLVGDVLEGALDYFGRRIVARWLADFERRPGEDKAALEDLARMPADEVRREAEVALDDLGLELADADRAAVLDYLSAIPNVLSHTFARADVAAVTRDAAALLAALPSDLPPYAAPCELPGTSYRLEALAAVGGFGSVYRAVDPRMPYLPLALKFCRDAAAVPTLRRERDNLERLLHADADAWSPHVVRLCGYDLDHATPYLVYEWVPGGDLAALLAARAVPPPADEVLGWMRGIVTGLAFAHARGVVHRDLKPANVLLSKDGVKVTDFGIGSAARPDASPATRTLRGAGTPRYMAPEQRRGAPADPRHDLYSVGVIWYQCLLGDDQADLYPGWEEELRRAGAPESHQALIRRCVGVIQSRPADAGELLRLLDQAEVGHLPERVPPLLHQGVKELRQAHTEAARPPRLSWLALLGRAAVGLVLLVFAAGVTAGFADAHRDKLKRLNDPDPEPGPLFYGTVYPITAGVLLFGAWYWAEGRRVRQHAERMRPILFQQAASLQRVFPEAVAAWGGQDALLRAGAVERIAGDLEAQVAAARRASSPGPAWEPTQTVPPVLVDLLRRIQRTHESIDRAAKSTWGEMVKVIVLSYFVFPILLAAVIAPTMALVIGLGAPPGPWALVVVVPELLFCVWGTVFVARLVLRRAIRSRQGKLRRGLTSEAKALDDLFPEAVAAWGGLTALLQPETVERILIQIDAGAPAPTLDQERRSTWKPAAPAPTVPPTAGHRDLDEALLRQYRGALKVVEQAAITPARTRTITMFLALCTGLLALGVLVALPVVFIALYGGDSDRTAGIPAVAIVGTCLAAGVCYGLSRWYYASQRRRRLAGPTRELADRAELLARAFPAEVEALGGVATLTDPRAGPRACAQLEAQRTP